LKTEIDDAFQVKINASGMVQIQIVDVPLFVYVGRNIKINAQYSSKNFFAERVANTVESKVTDKA
jgi:hypothetical protein